MFEPPPPRRLAICAAESTPPSNLNSGTPQAGEIRGSDPERQKLKFMVLRETRGI